MTYAFDKTLKKISKQANELPLHPSTLPLHASKAENSRFQIILTIFWVALLGFFFSQVELQIEGANGWASALPTWRIDKHWLLDIFWGGRPLTGYHAWVFSFMALMFHYPLVFMQHWSLKLEARALASIMLFWIVEDFLWFILNPAYGIERFNPAGVFWHKHWIWFAPTDYWTFLIVAFFLFRYSFKD